VLKADVSSIPRSQLTRKRGKNGEIYKLDFEIEMIIDSATIYLSLLYKGKRYGAVDFDFV